MQISGQSFNFNNLCYLLGWWHLCFNNLCMFFFISNIFAVFCHIAIVTIPCFLIICFVDFGHFNNLMLGLVMFFLDLKFVWCWINFFLKYKILTKHLFVFFIKNDIGKKCLATIMKWTCHKNNSRISEFLTCESRVLRLTNISEDAKFQIMLVPIMQEDFLHNLILKIAEYLNNNQYAGFQQKCKEASFTNFCNRFDFNV